MEWLFNRSREPSTWAGISGLVTAALGLASGHLDVSAALASALPAVLAVVKGEASR